MFVACLKGLFPRYPWLRGGGQVDMVAAQSSMAKAYLEKAGVDPTRILVTGYPGWDRLIKNSSEDKKTSAVEKLGSAFFQACLFCWRRYSWLVILYV